MAKFSSDQDIQLGAVAEASPKVQVGSMTRKSIYRVEAYPPVETTFVRAVLGDSLYNQFEEEIREILVPRGGDFLVPVGKLLQLLGNLATKTIVAALFSRPIWVDEAHNLVVMAGLTDSLDKHFKGSGYTAAWYVGLVSGTPTFAEGNTMASHPGWFEVAPYAGARPTLTLGTVVSGSVDNSAAKASYSITDTMVVGGAFVITRPTAGQTSGTLYGGAAFSGGNRSVANGDTLNVTCSLTATAA